MLCYDYISSFRCDWMKQIPSVCMDRHTRNTERTSYGDIMWWHFLPPFLHGCSSHRQACRSTGVWQVMSWWFYLHIVNNAHGHHRSLTDCIAIKKKFHLEQGFSTFLMLKPFNTIHHVVVSPIHKMISQWLWYNYIPYDLIQSRRSQPHPKNKRILLILYSSRQMSLSACLDSCAAKVLSKLS